MGFESASRMETKEFCGAPWPSKELKRKERNSKCPLIAPQKFFTSPATSITATSVPIENYLTERVQLEHEIRAELEPR
jgi:hypothetical protein